MIRGLDLFREHFAEHREAFVLIGGVACHEWLATQGLEFRATKDMDMVLVVESLDPAFIKRFWEFIETGKYRDRLKADDGRELYRFDKPENEAYPSMIEIFSRKPSNVDLADGQQIVPIKLDADSASLSAILLDDAYYELIRVQHNEEKKLPFASPAALIPLKARAYLDLIDREEKGEKVKSEDIAKHRTDVFRIAGTLPDETGPALPGSIQKDLKKFLAEFPPDKNEEWNAIRSGLKTTFGSTKMEPERLIGAIQTYFSLK
jgi:hypothetical protein